MTQVTIHSWKVHTHKEAAKAWRQSNGCCVRGWLSQRTILWDHCLPEPWRPGSIYRGCQQVPLGLALKWKTIHQDKRRRKGQTEGSLQMQATFFCHLLLSTPVKWEVLEPGITTHSKNEQMLYAHHLVEDGGRGCFLKSARFNPQIFVKVMFQFCCVKHTGGQSDTMGLELSVVSGNGPGGTGIELAYERNGDSPMLDTKKQHPGAMPAKHDLGTHGWVSYSYCYPQVMFGGPGQQRRGRDANQMRVQRLPT